MTSSWEKLLHGEERKALKIQGTGRESEARAICQNFPSVSVCQGLCVCGGGAVCVWRVSHFPFFMVENFVFIFSLFI